MRPPQKAKKQPLGRQPRKMPQNSRGLSDAALRYALAVTEPFRDGCIGASVPIANTYTQKATGFLRGSGRMGTAGVAYIAMAPSPTRDAPSIITTDGNYALTSFEPLFADNVTNPGVLLHAFPNLPHTSISILADDDTPVVSARVVSAGLRVRYMGTELNLGGESFVRRAPTHNSVQVAASGSSIDLIGLGGYRETAVSSYSRRTLEVTDHAFELSECEILPYSRHNAIEDSYAKTQSVYPFSRGRRVFVNNAGVEYTYDTGACKLGVPTAIIGITGTPGEPYYFEGVIHVEYTGIGAAHAVSRVVGDAQGLQTTLQSASATQIKRHADPRSAWSVMCSSLKEAENDLIKHAIPAAAQAVERLLAA